jgi:transcriptional regulator with XRE-family HTH domain
MPKPLPPTKEEIRAVRAAAGLTQAIAAAQLDLSAKTWQAYELGKRNMRRRDFDLFRLRVGLAH